DGQVKANAFFDPATLWPTRAKLWADNLDAVMLLDHLPPSVRQAFAGNVEGALSARIFVDDTDRAHWAARAELLAPATLRLTRRAPVATNPGGSPATAPGPSPAPRLAVLTNPDLSAKVAWNGRFDSLPELSDGRFTADILELLPPGNEAPVPLSK